MYATLPARGTCTIDPPILPRCTVTSPSVSSTRSASRTDGRLTRYSRTRSSCFGQRVTVGELAGQYPVAQAVGDLLGEPGRSALLVDAVYGHPVSASRLPLRNVAVARPEGHHVNPAPAHSRHGGDAVHEDGAVDEAALRSTVAYYATAGVGVYLGSYGTGEGHLLRESEITRIYEVGVDAAGDARRCSPRRSGSPTPTG